MTITAATMTDDIYHVISMTEGATDRAYAIAADAADAIIAEHGLVDLDDLAPGDFWNPIIEASRNR